MNKKFRPVAVLFILVVTFAVYWPSLLNQFVWDDTALVLRDPFIRSWRLIPQGFRHFLFTDATASNFYRPLQRLTYTLDYALYGFQPWGYHLTNILLHAGAAAALFLCAATLVEKSKCLSPGKGELPMLGASIAWAVHPVHSAAVCYVAGRADLLAALFGFAGLYFALGTTERNKTTGLNDWLAALCFLLAILSKESGVTALIIWLVGAWYLIDANRLRRWLKFAALILAIYCSLRFSAEKIPPPPQQATTVLAKPVLIARAWAEYAGLLIAPANLHMERDVVVLNRGDVMRMIRDEAYRDLQTSLGLFLIVAFFFWIRRVRTRSRAACFFLIAFLIAYLPISNLFSLNATVAEHWLYFCSAFLFAGIALTLEHLTLSRRLLAFVFALWVCGLAARTYLRNFDWRDQRTFLASTRICGGNTPRMMINQGLLESAEGRQPVAIGYFTEALHESPDQPFALIGLSSAYMRSQQYARAREILNRALSIPLIRAQALQDLAVLDFHEHGEDRVDLLHEAAVLAPYDWPIQKRYITHLEERGEIPKALHELERVLDQQPYRAESWKLLGDLLMKVNQSQAAATAYAQASSYDVHLK